MNNRQAGAYRELIQLEERTRDRWYKTRGLPVPGEANGSTGGQPGQRGNTMGRNMAEGTLDPYDYIPTVPAWAPQHSAGASFHPAAATYQPGLSFGSRSGTYLPPHPNGALPLPSDPLYGQAIRVSSPRMLESEQGLPRRVVRQVELPVARQVKVPISTHTMVPVQVERQVKTTRMVEEPYTALEPEQYYDFVYKPAVRQKEVWVKRTVPVRTMEAIAIPKVRHVPRQTTRLRAVDDWAVQTHTEMRPMSVAGYRVDDVVDSKLVEVDEEHASANPYGPASNARVVGARDIGLINGVHHSRRLGSEAFHPDDPRHAQIAEDHAPHSDGFAAGSAASSQQLSRSMLPYGRSLLSTSQTFGRTGVPGGDERTLGLRLRDGCDANGVLGALVVSVARDSPAERAGIRKHDVLSAANNKPTRGAADLRAILTSSYGPVLIQARRRGNQKLQVNVQR